MFGVLRNIDKAWDWKPNCSVGNFFVIECNGDFIASIGANHTHGKGKHFLIYFLFICYTYLFMVCLP